MEKKINVLITLTGKIISVNALYGCRIGRGPRGVYPQMYKVPEAKQMEHEIREQCRAIDFSEHLGWLRDSKTFDLNIQFVFKTNIGRRDCSNACKCAEDCWVKFVREDLGIDNYDDAKHARVILSKSIIPGADHEYICLQLTPSTFNMRYDQIDHPEQAIIWGDWEDTKTFKKAAKEKGIKYQAWNTDKKIKDHNTEIMFVKQVEDHWGEQIVDLMDFIYLHKDSGFTFIGIQGTDQGVVDKINSLGVSTIKAGLIEEPEDIFGLW